MSALYNSQPNTDGQVTLHTSKGDIAILLWAKQSPVACRNFVQLCLEGYYDGSVFYRVDPRFLIQAGSATAKATDNVYGEPFAVEKHSRIRFCHRGIVAMAASDNGKVNTDFFITLQEAMQLQGSHTIFGKVTSDSIYTAIDIGGGDVENEVPIFPVSIISIEVTVNPFPDISPRKISCEKVSSVEEQNRVSTMNSLSFDSQSHDAHQLKKRKRLPVETPSASKGVDTIDDDAAVLAKSIRSLRDEQKAIQAPLKKSESPQPAPQSSIAERLEMYRENKRRGSGSVYKQQTTLKRLSEFQKQLRQNNSLAKKPLRFTPRPQDFGQDKGP